MSDLKPRTRTTAMVELLETIAELTNDVITNQFGEEFDWDEHVGENWNFTRPIPPNVNPKDLYLFTILFDMRHEANDVLHYLSSATEEHLKEILEML